MTNCVLASMRTGVAPAKGPVEGDMGKDIRVMVVDDHPVVREGLRRMLELDRRIDVIGEAANGEEAVTKASKLSPDVITMDLKMPVMDGIAATREIKQRVPGVNVLMLTLYGEDFVKEAIEVGASGYLLKDTDCEQLIKAIYQVCDGLSPIDPSLTKGLVDRLARLMQHDHVSVLTKRQTEILKLVAEGAIGKEIAARLFVSPATVKREIRQTLRKLGVKDRAQAVSEAMKQKLI